MKALGYNVVKVSPNFLCKCLKITAGRLYWLHIRTWGQVQNILMWSTTISVHIFPTLQYPWWRCIYPPYNIHHGVVDTARRPHKLRQPIKITSKRRLMLCIKIKEIYIYISEKNELLWTSPEKDCWNTEEERIPNYVLIVKFIKRSHTNCKFD